jgi:hypothetical protein
VGWDRCVVADRGGSRGQARSGAIGSAVGRIVVVLARVIVIFGLAPAVIVVFALDAPHDLRIRHVQDRFVERARRPVLRWIAGDGRRR